MSSSAVTRKRSRQYLEVDELSPEKEAPQANTPLASLKRRKLNTYGSSPSMSSTKTKGVFGRLGGIFGFGSPHAKEKENRVEEEDDEEKDELGHEGDIWEVNASDTDEEQIDTTTTPVKDVSALGKGKKRGRKRKVVDDIWEMPGSDPDEQAGQINDVRTKGKKTPEPSRAVSAPTSKTQERKEEIASPRRSVGRPRKADILKKEKALSRGAIRKRLSAGNQAELEGEEDAKDTPLSRRSDQSTNSDIPGIEDGDEIEDTIAVTPSGRKRGRPRKEEIVGSAKQVPKGLLTPTKNGTKKNRKSVAFEDGQSAQDEPEVDLGFKDLPKSASKKLSRVPKRSKSNEGFVADLAEPDEPPVRSKQPSVKQEDVPSLEEEIDSDDSDLACAVCGGLDSDKPNEILICDNCDFAVHQECYKVPIVPSGDWFCRDCKPEEDGTLKFDFDDEDVRMESTNDLPEIEGFEDHLRGMQRLLLDKLTGQKRIKLRGHDEEVQKVHQIVEQTILAGEGNSMLVIGARGCGKTTLVESVISDLSAEHRENFHVVRLNGFIHTDDKLALKATWRQLGREMEVEDELTSKGNYADTLSSLLALLSHPSEISECQSEKTAKSVIFILDEFDLFTTHPRQTLLYNLFDIAQARKAPIVVLGLTTRVDVVDSLEKRVKSRFSHRYIHLSLPRSLPAFWEICKDGLTVDTDELEAEGFDPTAAGHEDFHSFWQSMIDDLYNTDPTFKHHLQSHFYRTKSVPAFFTSCILPIVNLSPKNVPLDGKKFTLCPMSLAAPDSKLHILQGLSDLELALLIAAARLDIILDTDTCNFAMAYDEYSSLTSRHKIQISSTGVAALGASAKVWGRDVALGAWERLADYELLVPTGIGGGGGGRDFGAGGRMWKVDVGLEEITGSLEGLSGVMTKWCREI